MYITATSPYLFMLALLIRNCLLPGARGGIEFYLTPQWERLADLEVSFHDIFLMVKNNLR
jgi:SNF family Na+-dependent transporter